MARLVVMLALVCPGLAHADVVINEFLPNPAGADAGSEYVELLNTGSESVDLEGWTLEAGTSSFSVKATLPAGTRLAPGAYLVLGESGVVEADVLTGTLSLGNASSSGDALRIVDSLGVTVDTVVYGPDNTDAFLDDDGATAVPAPKPRDGAALGRLPNGSDTNDSSVDVAVLDTNSPGVSNEPPAPTCDLAAAASGMVINEFLADPEGADAGLEWVELYSDASTPLDLSGWRIEGGSSSFGELATFAQGYTFVSGAFVVVGGEFVAEATIPLTGSLGNASSNADAIRLVDCLGTSVDTVIYGSDNSDAWRDDDGAVATSLAPKPGSGESLARSEDGLDTNDSGADFAVPREATPGASNPEPLPCALGDVVINELLVNPEGADAGFEWVELYNPTPGAISLAGWQLDASTSAFSEGQSLPDVEVPAGGFVLIGQESVPGVDVLLDESLGNASSNADGVQLRDCEGAVVDTVIYGAVNEDGWVDDTDELAVSLAPSSAEGASMARLQDGYDNDESGLDFVVDASPTPGQSNPVREPIVCVPALGATVVLNEAMVNPEGPDGGFEWIELYNPTDVDVSIAGWGIADVADADEEGQVDAVVPGGVQVPANGFLVLGGDMVPEADVSLPMVLGNGSSGDALVLYDCENTRIDGIVYGPDNEDLVLDDLGDVVDPYIVSISSGHTLARVNDGEDSDAAADWFSDSTPTPGSTNLASGGPVDGPTGGCGNRNDEAPDPTEPKSGCGRDSTPQPAALFIGLITFAGLGRRRR
ncbi:MAG: lamin tail domain-containing protein [Myxococcota bacterium]